MPILTSPAGYGLRPIHMVGGGAYTGAFETFRLGSVATSTALTRGNLVRVSATGVFSASVGTGFTPNTGGAIGVLEGVEYDDAKGAYTIGTYLPASATSTLAGYTNAKLRIITDPGVVYEALANNTLLKAAISSTGALTALGGHCSLTTVDASATDIFGNSTGLLTTAGTVGTIGLTIVGVNEGLIDEALNATTYADSNWVGALHVRINPTIHIASAGVGI
jgi:hypothetical protein